MPELAWQFIPNWIDFTSARHGWLSVGNGIAPGSKSTLLETSDGGRSWFPARSRPSRAHNPMRGVWRLCHSRGLWSVPPSFWTPSDGYAVCGEQARGGAQGFQHKWLFETSDGGRTWVERASPRNLPLDFFIRELVFFDRKHGVMLSDNHDTSYIYVTDDGGQSWRNSFYPGAGAIDWSWPDRRDGYLAVKDDGVYLTHDFGRTWRRVFPAPEPIGPISYASPESAVGVIAPSGREGRDYRAVFRTSDGGLSWKQSGQIPSGIVSRLIRLSPTELLAVTGNGPFSLRGSDDDGRHWRKLAMPKIGEGIGVAGDLSISFAGPDGYLVDPGSGTLYESRDSGSSWRIADRSGYSSVALLGGKRLLAVSGFGVYSSDDGGRRWDSVRITVSGRIQSPVDVVAIDPSHIWIATESGLLLRTGNGGASWSAYRLGNFGYDGLNQLYFTSPQVGFASLGLFPVYAGIPMVMTRDGGRTWKLLPLAPSEQN